MKDTLTETVRVLYEGVKEGLKTSLFNLVAEVIVVIIQQAEMNSWLIRNIEQPFNSRYLWTF